MRNHVRSRGIGVLLVALIAGLAQADSDRDRRTELVSKIDRKVDDIAGEISGLESRSDASNVHRALDHLKELEGLVGDLKGKEGDDPRARTIVDKYPAYARTLREAAGHLVKLKDGQRVADGGADRCRADEADLQTLLRAWVGDPDRYAEGALVKLPEKGRAYGATWSERLGAWGRHHGTMASSASSARFTESDWSKVSSSFTASASAIASHWMKAYEDAARTCERLAKGDRHDDIAKAITDLTTYRTTSKQTYKAVEADYRTWLVEIQKLRRFTVDDRDELRKAMCFLGEYEMESKVTEIADRWANQIKSAYGTAMGQADRLLERTNAVEKRAPKSAPKLRDAIVAVRKSLDSLSSYELNGSANPKVRAKLEYGKKAHADKQSSCTYKELEISSKYCKNPIRSGSDCRLDCFMASDCTVYEVKPDSTEAMKEGDKQAKAYARGLEAWWSADKASLFKAYPGVQKCEKDGKFEIKDRIVDYSFCPGSEADLGQPLDPIEPAVSAEGD